MSISDRINQLIEDKNVTGYQIAVKTGISEGAISRIRRDKTAKMTIRNIEKLANYFNVSSEWLNTGLGNKDIEPVSREADNSELKVKMQMLQDRINEVTEKYEAALMRIGALEHEIKKKE